jgi:hypothetical protein
MVLRVVKGPFGTLDEALFPKVEAVFAGENLLQMILHAHLLLERAVDAKITEKLLRPSALGPTGSARFSFAQKIALYVGLFDPPQPTELLLAAFNRLRNSVAHELNDLDSAVRRFLRPALHEAAKLGGSSSPLPDDPSSLVRVVFGGLMLFDLDALPGVMHDDDA